MNFSDTVNNTGILQQVRKMMRVDANQWPTVNVVNSCNNYLDVVTGYAIGADKRFQFDDTNHTALPEGTTNLVADQSDYSFLTDEQGNTILTLIRVELLGTTGGTDWRVIHPIDQSEYQYDSLNALQVTAGLSTTYDKIADNIIRLYPKPSTSVTSGIKFSFQRTPSYFDADATSKAPGVAPILHRGFVIAAAYDGALTLGLANLNALSVEMLKEERKMVQYFTNRKNDERNILTMAMPNFR